MTFLIIGSASGSNRKIKRAFELKGEKAYIISPKKFSLVVSAVNGHDKVYINGKRLHANQISGIIPRLGSMTTQGLSVVHHLNRNMGVYTTSTAQGLRQASDKYISTQLLSEARIKTPQTIHVKSTKNLQTYVDMLGGYPVVGKTNKGSQGKGVFLLESNLAATTAMDVILSYDEIQLQEFIETSGSGKTKKDIRAWVVGDTVVAAMERHSTISDFRSNYSISKTAIPVTLTPTQKTMAINAAKAVGLEAAGVDLMVEFGTGTSYVIEVNGNASLNGIESVTGIDVSKHIADYCISNGKPTSESKADNANFSAVERESWIDEDESDDGVFSDPGTIEVGEVEASSKSGGYVMSGVTMRAMEIYKSRQRQKPPSD